MWKRTIISFSLNQLLVMSANKKDLIVHITAGGDELLKTKLHENGLFSQYYDGNEHTVKFGQGIISTRYYYYDVPHSEVLLMLRHLRQVGTDHTYKIKIGEAGKGGNYNFD